MDTLPFKDKPSPPPPPRRLAPPPDGPVDAPRPSSPPSSPPPSPRPSMPTPPQQQGEEVPPPPASTRASRRSKLFDNLRGAALDWALDRAAGSADAPRDGRLAALLAGCPLRVPGSVSTDAWPSSPPLVRLVRELQVLLPNSQLDDVCCLIKLTELRRQGSRTLRSVLKQLPPAVATLEDLALAARMATLKAECFGEAKLTAVLTAFYAADAARRSPQEQAGGAREHAAPPAASPSPPPPGAPPPSLPRPSARAVPASPQAPPSSRPEPHAPPGQALPPGLGYTAAPLVAAAPLEPTALPDWLAAAEAAGCRATEPPAATALQAFARAARARAEVRALRAALAAPLQLSAAEVLAESAAVAAARCATGAPPAAATPPEPELPIALKPVESRPQRW